MFRRTYLPPSSGWKHAYTPDIRGQIIQKDINSVYELLSADVVCYLLMSVARFRVARHVSDSLEAAVIGTTDASGPIGRRQMSPRLDVLL
jgi:hypothetical protein